MSPEPPESNRPGCHRLMCTCPGREGGVISIFKIARRATRAKRRNNREKGENRILFARRKREAGGGAGSLRLASLLLSFISLVSIAPLRFSPANSSIVMSSLPVSDGYWSLMFDLGCCRISLTDIATTSSSDAGGAASSCRRWSHRTPGTWPMRDEKHIHDSMCNIATLYSRIC